MIIKILLGIIALYLLVWLGLYLVQAKLLLYPEKLPQNYAFPFGYPFEELFLKVDEKTVLNALYFEHQSHDKQGVVLYLHGNAGSLAGWGDVAGDFVGLGYDVLVVDYRGFGKSTGQLYSENDLFADAQFCYNYLANKHNTNEIVIYGRSLGTGPASYLAANNDAKQLILETPFYSLLEIIQQIFPFIPHSVSLRFKLVNISYLEKANLPIHIFHGTADKVVPYDSGKKLAQAIHQAELTTIEGGNHHNLRMYPQYQLTLGQLLTKK